MALGTAVNKKRQNPYCHRAKCIVMRLHWRLPISKVLSLVRDWLDICGLVHLSIHPCIQPASHSITKCIEKLLNVRAMIRRSCSESDHNTQL